MSYVKEPFEELDVMNFFMFNKLTTEPEIAEDFCRCMLRNLLGKEVSKISIQAEKMQFPDDPKKRGVRLDVEVRELTEDETVATIYDIEPHRDKEDAYPKKNRYTQAMIDKNNLKSGENDFNKLPDLYIICITNYDPFGFDRMMYEIKTCCAEEPSLVYNDGVRIMYFNTTGTIGGSYELRSFLKYLEESKSANVVDNATKEVNQYVNRVKENKKIGGVYMTFGNLMDKIVAEAIADKDAELADKDAELADKDAKLADKDAMLADMHAEIERLKAELQNRK